MLKSSIAAHNFGIALVLLGIAMLIVGIGYHVTFMVGLRRERAAMKADGLVHAESQFPGFANADGRDPAPRDRVHGHHEHGVQRRAVWLTGSGPARDK